LKVNGIGNNNIYRIKSSMLEQIKVSDIGFPGQLVQVSLGASKTSIEERYNLIS
jgi:hypothetical protein